MMLNNYKYMKLQKDTVTAKQFWRNIRVKWEQKINKWKAQKKQKHVINNDEQWLMDDFVSRP